MRKYMDGVEAYVSPGVPMLVPRVYDIHSNNPNHQLHLMMTKIPQNTKKNTVALSATASIKFHYGVRVTAEQVRNIYCCIM